MFALTWYQEALDQLADVYVVVTRDERERIAAGVEALNSRLRADPMDEGESRGGDRRLTFVPLLAVVFYVDEADRSVWVRSVYRFGR